MVFCFNKSNSESTAWINKVYYIEFVKWPSSCLFPVCYGDTYTHTLRVLAECQPDIPPMYSRLEPTSVDSLTIQLKSCAIVGCRLGLSIPSVVTTMLKATRYSKGLWPCSSFIWVSLLDVCNALPLFGL